MSTTTQRKLTQAGVKGIMTKRIMVPANAVGKRVKFLVQGNGNTVDVKNKEGDFVTSTIPGYEGTVLQKKIFNLRANSAVAMSNTRNRQYLIDALKAEKAGDAEKAHELFNEYLNSTQMSFGILLPSNIADKLSAGVEIAATVTEVTTENGSLLTIDPSTISIVEPEVYGSTSFDMSDFIEDDEEEPVEVEEAVKA